MRHGRKINHLSRTHEHREALLSNLASSLILHKRIKTTVAKARALRVYVEPLLTRSKMDTTHNRRTVFSYLGNKEAIKVLFGEISSKIGERPGGYTRILKVGNRPGDNAEMCLIELVDFNETYLKDATPKTRRKRTRRAGGKAEGAGAIAAPEVETATEGAASTGASEEANPPGESDQPAEDSPAAA